MLTALILVCFGGVSCNVDTASYILRTDVYVASPSRCLMLGEAYLANTSLGVNVAGDMMVHILCIRTEGRD